MSLVSLIDERLMNALINGNEVVGIRISWEGWLLLEEEMRGWKRYVVDVNQPYGTFHGIPLYPRKEHKLELIVKPMRTRRV